MPGIVTPQNIPTMGTKQIIIVSRDMIPGALTVGVQKGSKDIVNFAPRIAIGIVEPSIPISTEGNYL